MIYVILLVSADLRPVIHEFRKSAIKKALNYKDKGFCVKFYSKFADRLFLFCMKQINNARPDIACKVE
jgi:hypothetical protein